VNNELDFVKQIGRNGEPDETKLLLELARDFWAIWPKMSIVERSTRRSVAENNVRAALLMINELDGDESINQEKLLLAAIDRNIGFNGTINKDSAEFRLAEQSFQPGSAKKSRAATQIADLTKGLTSIKRDILLSVTHWENDSEHTLATALIAWKIASNCESKLDRAEVVKMALVHELAETITGDVSSFNLTAEQLEKKRQKDSLAAQEFAEKYAGCSRLVDKFMKYESKKSPEAVFVYWIDKVMPAFSKYQPHERAHFLAPAHEIYKHGGLAHPGRNGNRETVANWYQNTKKKLLVAGTVPHSICEELLEQNLIWLNWLIEYNDKSRP
jgi:5'-deoxynucleotidase YfbR-like HD superfamily hydrolase